MSKQQLSMNILTEKQKMSQRLEELQARILELEKKDQEMTTEELQARMVEIEKELKNRQGTQTQ